MCIRILVRVHRRVQDFNFIHVRVPSELLTLYESVSEILFHKCPCPNPKSKKLCPITVINYPNRFDVAVILLRKYFLKYSGCLKIENKFSKGICSLQTVAGFEIVQFTS